MQFSVFMFIQQIFGSSFAYWYAWNILVGRFLFQIIFFFIKISKRKQLLRWRSVYVSTAKQIQHIAGSFQLYIHYIYKFMWKIRWQQLFCSFAHFSAQFFWYQTLLQRKQKKEKKKKEKRTNGNGKVVILFADKLRLSISFCRLNCFSHFEMVIASIRRPFHFHIDFSIDLSH